MKKRKKEKEAAADSSDEAPAAKKKKKDKEAKNKSGKMACESEDDDEKAAKAPSPKKIKKASDEKKEEEAQDDSDESSSAPVDVDDPDVDVVPNTLKLVIGFGSSSSSSSSSSDSSADPDELELLPDPDAVEHVETRRNICRDAVKLISFNGPPPSPMPMGSPALTTPGDISSTDSDSSDDSPVKEIAGEISDGEGSGKKRPCIVPIGRVGAQVRGPVKQPRIVATAAVPIGLDEACDGGAVASDDDVVLD